MVLTDERRVGREGCWCGRGGRPFGGDHESSWRRATSLASRGVRDNSSFPAALSRVASERASAEGRHFPGLKKGH